MWYDEAGSSVNIKDSGNRRNFESGAVRDIAENKGRCDLIPLEEAAFCLDLQYHEGAEILLYISQYMETNDKYKLIKAIEQFANLRGWDIPTALLEVSIHYEDGTKKYGERNWEKGIPLHSYIDSGVRHLLKYLRGDTDERHDRAFIWNMLGVIWTAKRIPNMIDIDFSAQRVGRCIDPAECISESVQGVNNGQET